MLYDRKSRLRETWGCYEGTGRRRVLLRENIVAFTQAPRGPSITKSRLGPAEDRRGLVRCGGLLFLHLELVDDLLHVGHAGGDTLDLCAPALGINVAGQLYDALDDVILHGLHPMLYERRVEVLFDAGVEIGINLLGVAFAPWRRDGDLIGYHLRRSEGARDGLGLSLLIVGRNLASQCQDAEIAILAHLHSLEARLV